MADKYIKDDSLKLMKKIDVVVKYFYPVAAGIETNILETYSILAKKGWNVVIHTSNIDYTSGKRLSEKEIIEGLIVKRYPLLKFFLSPDLDWSHVDALCLHNFNILPHFNIFIHALFKKVIGKKKFALILIPHGGFNPEWSIFSKPVALIKSYYHSTVGRSLINLVVDGVRTVSGWERAEMVQMGVRGGLIKVIRNGIEDKAYLDIDGLASKKIKKEVQKLKNYVIQVGRIYPIKNQEAAIRALSLVKSDLKLVFVGPCQDRNYKRKLTLLIKELKLKDRVFFLGVIRGVDKYYLLRHAKAMVHMALWEGNCNVVHEAWSQKTLCIVADVRGLNEQIQDRVNGFLIPQNDCEYLSKKIDLVVNGHNSSLINKIKISNTNYVNGNSWKDVTERIEKFYSDKIGYIK